jgi:HD-GYP domain-containing protein (c-di-GMP phosphodiesterase class II)
MSTTPPSPTPPNERVRLGPLLVGLSLAADAGMGLEPGEAARATVIATALARELGVADASDVYYTTLLQHVGCTAYAHEAAALLGGDEIAVKSAAVRTDFARPREVLLGYLPNLAPHAGLAGRLRAAGVAATRAGRITAGYTAANCEVASLTARRLGLGMEVERSLAAVFEQVNGRGAPRGLARDEIPPATRIAQVAVCASLFDRMGGVDLAVRSLRRRAGRSLDADVIAALCDRAPALLGELGSADAVVAAIAAEPAPTATVPGDAVDDVCRAFGDVVDLKSPYHHGHAAGVAELAAGAAARLQLPAEDVARVRRAGYLHDLGRTAVPNGIWEKPAPLTASEWERVRLQAYHSERILSGSPALAPLARLAGMHHERLDGSGYHREAGGGDIPMLARVLAAADAFQAMTQPRAYRPAHAPEAAAEAVSREAAQGRLDPEAAAAVREEAGHRAPGRRPRTGGLTDRQLEVVRLVAQGLSNRDIARALVVSPRTAERHVQDIYARIGVSTRAGAALFAMQHGLLKDR